MTFRCATCDEEHDGLPDLGCEHPDPYLEVPEPERAARTTLSADLCVVRGEDGEHCFIRGVIILPVIGQDERSSIGAWVSQSRANYDRYATGVATAPTFGWLVSRLSHCGETTFLLKTRVHFRPGGLGRPSIELEPTEHELAVEQRRGITLARAWEIVHHYLPS